MSETKVTAKKEMDLTGLDKNQLLKHAEKLAAENVALQKEKIALTQDKATLEVSAKNSIADADAAKAKVKTLEDAAEQKRSLASEVAEVTRLQQKFFDQTWPAFVVKPAKVKTGKNGNGKVIEVGFLPGIHKVRIPGLQQKIINVKNEAGELIRTVRLVDYDGTSHIDHLIAYAPDEIQKLFDKKADIFKDLKTDETIFGKKAVAAEVVEVVE